MLQRRRIADEALKLLDDVGLDQLTTRKLAERLNVQGPSLYHHFANKNELLGEMAALLLERVVADLDPWASWETWLRSVAWGTRRGIMSHRDAARLLTTSWPTATMRQEIIPGIVAPLVARGLPLDKANYAVGLIASFVIGWTMNEQNASIAEYIQSVGEVEAGFAFGVDTIVGGMRLLFDAAEG